MLYAELMHQSQRVMADGVNAMQRLLRMRARPKILLAENFEEGWSYFEKYQNNLLGIISDARFPRAGKIDPHAGIEFVRRVRVIDPDMPALIQSSDQQLAGDAAELGAAFLNKRSPHLLNDLGKFIQRNLGFGDFVFILPDGTEVTRVRDLAGMARALKRVPVESLRYHAARNHFSNWCMARTEFRLARKIRPIKISEFEDTEDLRRYLVYAFSQLRTDTHRGVVAEFSLTEFGEASGFARIGSGSLGGKGRGLGFVTALLTHHQMPEELTDIRVYVPPAAVLGTDIFDDFLDENALHDIALSDAEDQEIAAAFLRANLPEGIVGDLQAFVDRVEEPLAVRSSSLLEDSYDRPFAGIYRTYMLPNNDPNPMVRFEQLCDAIKLVYASIFYQNAKAYLQTTQHRIEEEKMAVVLQKLVGRRHGDYFYPDIGGTACSYNYYPVLETTPEDGVAVIALGLGKTVVDGERAVRFSPGRPQSLPQFSSTEDYLENAQRQFYALDMNHHPVHLGTDPNEAFAHLDLDASEEHGTLTQVASTYSPDNDAVYDGISRAGIRLVTFAPILKAENFPLSRTLSYLLALGSRSLSCPVEIEFAVNLKPEHGGPPEFAFLQLRPMIIEAAAVDLDELLDRVEQSDLLCSSTRALGHGRMQEITDVIYVRPESFDRSSTAAIAREVGALNKELAREGRLYLLIGPGRWGTSDPWLGIPVEWHQISASGTIVETDLGDVAVAPSEGTHFFQNLTSFGIGYFNVHHKESSNFVDYEWLDRQTSFQESSYLRHLRLDQPLDIWVDGRSRRGLILKQGS
jgi:hypothetical protein